MSATIGRTAIQAPGGAPDRPAGSSTVADPAGESPVRIGLTGGGLKRVGHTLETVVFTVAVQLLLAVGPVALVWWVIQAWSRSNVVLLDLLTAVAVASSAGAWLRVLRPEAPIRRFLFVPVAVQNSARHLIERSAFGVGRLDDWTSAEPDHGLSLIRRPSSVDELRNSGLLATERCGRGTTGAVERSRDIADTPSVRTITAVIDESPRHRTVEHVVARGESFWSLAEQRLGDGRRWTEIRDLNTGREVAPGVVLSERDAPQVGHRILVPDTTPPDA